LVGLIFGFIAYWLITSEHVNPLVIVPAIVAVTIGATHLIKHEAPHE
jgi:mannose/fructose/N-acetylgalactosamine-specific phosphotransferase system component IID